MGSDGRVWFGTREGIYVWDGQRMRRFSTATADSQTGPMVDMVALEDSVWVALSREVWHITRWRVHKYQNRQDTPIGPYVVTDPDRKIVKGDGRVFVTDGKLLLWSTAEGDLEPYPQLETETNINALFYDELHMDGVRLFLGWVVGQHS